MLDARQLTVELDVENGVVRALDALARAPMPPKVSVDAAVRVDTALKWPAVSGASAYQIVMRRTDQPAWDKQSAIFFITGSGSVDGETVGPAQELSKVSPVRGDDWLFGVSSCALFGREALCSPVSSAVPGGAFEPVAKE